MPEPNPLEGLTSDQADDAITKMQDKVDKQEAFLRDAKEQLRRVKAARKELTPAEETRAGDPAGNGVQVQAGTAEGSGGAR
jgi:hypothetical protein